MPDAKGKSLVSYNHPFCNRYRVSSISGRILACINSVNIIVKSSKITNIDNNIRIHD